MNPFATSLSNALVITQREVRDSFRDWRILGPILIMTFAFPYLANELSGRMIDFVNFYGGGVISTRAIPFLLMVVGFFPVSLSLVIALETFVGEKERRSLEPLLSTPLTNWELYVGKTLASMIPPLLASIGGMAIYLLFVVGGTDGWRPQPTLVIQIAILTLMQTLVMVAGSVVVSSQTTSVRAANLLASFILVPMALVIQIEAAIVFTAPDFNSPNGVGFLWFMIIAMFVVAVLLLRMGAAIFNREELLGRSLDSFNIKGILLGLWRNFRAVDDNGTPARSLGEIYTRAIPYTFQRLRPMLFVGISAIIGAFVFGFMVGTSPAYQPTLPSNLFTTEGMQSIQVFSDLVRAGLDGSLSADLYSLNLRYILVGVFLSMITFGVVPLILLPILVGVLGFATAALMSNGLSVAPVWAAFLPHLLLVVPVLVIMITASFRLGALLTKLPPGKTIGQAWSQALGDAFKLFVFVALPVLTVAYLVERAVMVPLVTAALGG
ncbi:MAG: stage II sporulation protein M [Anaerolineae bacterium]|nr:stage II sporulation protein M [Anaerolineae bacterium]